MVDFKVYLVLKDVRFRCTWSPRDHGLGSLPLYTEEKHYMKPPAAGKSYSAYLIWHDSQRVWGRWLARQTKFKAWKQCNRKSEEVYSGHVVSTMKSFKKDFFFANKLFISLRNFHIPHLACAQATG
jgi:hypothetical protein